MPSRDSTGKRLSGGAQRALAEERRVRAGNGAQAEHAVVRLEVAAPPRGQGVDALIAWAARVQVQVVALARRGEDPARVRAVGAAVRALAGLKNAAADSERACQALAQFFGEVVPFDGPDPPAQDAGLMAWAAWSLGDLVYEAATEPDVCPAWISHQAAALRLLEKVAPQAALDQVADRLAEEQDGGDP